MIQTPSRNWWLLALCGVFEAGYAVVILLMRDQNGSPTWRTFLTKGTILLLGELAVVAGVCTMAAGLWSANGKSWLVALNGFALGALGALELIVAFWTLRMSFRPFVLLFIVMALSVGSLALANARTLRGAVADKWLLRLAGAIAFGFALAFLVLALGWVNLRQHPPEFLNIWMGCYFAFSAICMLGLAVRLHGRGLSRSGPTEALPSLGNPEHAH
jgi:hypothetical protein